MISKSISFILLLLFCGFSSSYAQLSEGGQPFSFTNQVSATIEVKKMPGIDIEVLLREDAATPKSEPYRFGHGFDVSYNLKNSGTWYELPNKSKLWRMKIVSQGAFSINLIYNKFWLPDGAEFYIYNSDRSMIIGAFTARNNKLHGKFATGLVKGDEIILEYYEPYDVTIPGEISISRVVHAYRNFFKSVGKTGLKKTFDFGDSESCNNNVYCPEAEGWQDEVRSVGMIVMSDGTRLCTGSIINNVRGDYKPYFLTANHCLEGDVNTWVFWFNYESSTCENPNQEPTPQTLTGATLKANNSASDFALLLLDDIPPYDYNIFYSGWSNINTAPTSSVVIHHPSGDIKKISYDYDQAISDTYSETPPNSHWKVVWDDGTTEGGSSGSPLYNPDHRVVGQLHGGTASCSAQNDPDYFGKLSLSWNYGSSSSSRLKDWLDTDNTGAQTLDGLDGGLLYLASENKSVSQTATSHNNGRRLVRDGSSYWHLVFSSGGQIFYRKRTPWGQWQTPIQLSNGLSNNFPCITVTNNADLFAVWQRNSGTNTYEIYFAMSQDWGDTWTIEHKYILTTVTSSVDPLPVVHAYYPGYYKIIVFRSNSGLISYKTSTQYPYYINWTQQDITSDANYSRPTLANGNGGSSITLLAYQYNSGGIYYRYHNSSVWSSAINLSSIVPGSGVHQTPSITNILGNPQIHVAWKKLIGSGSSIYDHLIVHRRATNYYTWPNEWFGTYYNSQEYPSITGLATNKVDLLYQTPLQFGTPYVYRMRFDGNYWGSPISVASNARYPSVSSGQTTANYVWTSGSTAPYTVSIGSGLSKEIEVDPKDYYLRSIALLDSSENYIELKIYFLGFKLSDGTIKRMDYSRGDLNSFDLTTTNAWDSLGITSLNVIPKQVQELILDYSIEAKNINNVANIINNDLSVEFDILDSRNNLLTSKSLNHSAVSNQINLFRKELTIPINSFAHVPLATNIKASVRINNLTPKEGTFASLGHIFDYTSLASDQQNEEKIATNEPIRYLTVQNYPNPFNPTTKFNVTVPKEGFASLKIYDILGRKVTELINSKLNIGIYEFQFDASAYPSGVYFYRLELEGEKSLIKKMLLIK